MWPFGKSKKKKEADKPAPELEQTPEEGLPQATGDSTAPAPLAERSGHDARIERKAERKADHESAKAAHQLSRELQKALKRPVILVEERKRDQAVRGIMEHRRAIVGLGVLGTSIATVCTAGTAAGALAIVAACLPAADFKTFFDTETHDPNRRVRLEPGAVSLLLKREDAAVLVQAAIDATPDTGSGGLVTLSTEDIQAIISPKPEPEPVPKQHILDIHITPVRAGVRMGLTVIGGGLLLLALTLIPEDIHGLMIKVASAILVVGAVIVGAAVTNGSWLTGLGHDASQTPAALTGDGNHSPF